MARTDIFNERKNPAIETFCKTRDKIKCMTKKSVEYSVSEANYSSTGPMMRFLTPFALAMHATASTIGILYTLPIFIGSTVQLALTSVLSKLKNRKKTLMTLIILQNISWLPMIMLPFFAFGNLKLLILFATINAILYSIASPIWNSLIGDVIPTYRRGEFFGSKSIHLGILAFLGTITAGLLLTYFKDRIFLAFSIIFAVAVIWRISTNKNKIKLEEPGYNPNDAEKFTIKNFVSKVKKTNYGRFVKYASFMEFSINLSRPFIAYYMLTILKFDYLTFAFIISGSLIATFASTPLWGKFIDKHGSAKTVYITGLILPLPLLIWVFTSSIPILIIAEIISGVAIAGYKISSSIFILDNVKSNNLIKSTSYYNFFIGLATLIGGLIGAATLKLFEATISLKALLITLIILSLILQLAFTIRLGSQITESRFVQINFSPNKKTPTYYNPFIKQENQITIKPAITRE